MRNRKYTPFFCEENIWHLGRERSQHQPVGDFSVWILRGRGSAFVIFAQKAAVPGEPLFWDYHVVLVDDHHRLVYDFDTLAPFPCPEDEYLQWAFGPGQAAPIDVQGLIRAVDLSVYLHRFSSDRSHMLDERGCPLHPFPLWPCLTSTQQPLTLKDLLDPVATDQDLRPFRLWRNFGRNDGKNLPDFDL